MNKEWAIEIQKERLETIKNAPACQYCGELLGRATGTAYYSCMCSKSIEDRSDGTQKEGNL